MAVPDNYLEIIDKDYFFPSSYQSGIHINKTGGYPNVIETLYSDEGLIPFGSNLSDPYRIMTTTQNQTLNTTTNNTREIRIILPEGVHQPLDQNAGSIGTLCQNGIHGGCSTKYRGLIRSYCTRMPGFSFSGKSTVLASAGVVEGLISYSDYQ